MSRGAEKTFFQRKYIVNRHMKRCSTSLILGKCKLKTQWDITSRLLDWLLSNRQEISVGEDVEKREALYSVGGNVNCCSHYGIQHGGFLKKLILELHYDPVIPLLGIYLRTTKIPIWKDICSSMFIMVFTIAKIWKQPKCPSIDEWIRKCDICI